MINIEHILKKHELLFDFHLQEFHVAYFLIKMANSPRPGVWALERSVDYGKTWKAWQYFADTESDCYDFFGVPVTNKITRDDQVICTTEYSKIVPLEGGEVRLRCYITHFMQDCTQS